MNENSTNTELLIQFLDGELHGEQLEDFKKSIEQNASLREELENLRLTKEAVKSYGLKNRIHSIHSEMVQELKEKSSPQTGMVRKMYQYGVRIAAVIIILFGISVFYQYITATPEKLFNENYQSFELHETRGASANSLDGWYKKGNMDTVIQLFNGLKSPQAEDYFLAGNAFLSTHQPAKAIESFLAINQINKTANTHYFEEDADYYLALSYLGNREPRKALPVLEKIHADPSHPYNKKVSAWFLFKVKRSIKS